jgi:hypothetical protein
MMAMWEQIGRACRTAFAVHLLTITGHVMAFGRYPIDYGSAVVIESADCWRMDLSGLN